MTLIADPLSGVSFASISWRWVWFTAAAFIAGVLNAVAGGGSFLSFPAILGMGVLPVQANATNTVAIWPGQLTALAGYHSLGPLPGSPGSAESYERAFPRLQ